MLAKIIIIIIINYTWNEKGVNSVQNQLNTI